MVYVNSKPKDNVLTVKTGKLFGQFTRGNILHSHELHPPISLELFYCTIVRCNPDDVKCYTFSCYVRYAKSIAWVGGMLWPKICPNSYHSLPHKGCAIKGLVVCNIWVWHYVFITPLLGYEDRFNIIEYRMQWSTNERRRFVKLV